jgi:hypothetical protein
MGLHILYASLNDWKPDYVSFRDHNLPTMSSSQLSEAWSDRLATTMKQRLEKALRESPEC